MIKTIPIRNAILKLGIMFYQWGKYRFFKNILFVFILRETGREGEREVEKHQCVVTSHMPLTGDLACNPDMCPDQGSNWQPFGLQASTQSTEPHKPRHKFE